MTKQASIKKNFVMNAILTMSSFIFPLITFPYVSRILGPSGTGKVSLAISWVTYFSMFAQLGIPTYGIRACAQIRDDKEQLSKTAIELVSINIVLGLISYSVFFVLILFVPSMYKEKTLYIIMSSFILLNSIGMEWLYKALEQYDYITKRSIAFKFVALLAMFLLIHSKSDYIIYGAISIFASSASNVLNFLNAHRHIDWSYRTGLSCKRHFKHIAIFFAMACASTVYTNLDTVMLGFWAEAEDVGYYNAAVKIKTVLVSVVTSLGNVLLPRASYYVENKLIDDFKRITKKALNFVFVIAIPFTLYFILFSQSAIYLLSGNEYQGSVVPMKIIMPTLVFIGITNILGLQILVPTHHEKAVMISEVCGAIVDAIINACLIPTMKSSGAAIGTLVAEFLVLIIQYIAVMKVVPRIFDGIHILRYTISTLTAGICSVGFIHIINRQFEVLNDFAALAVSFLVFWGIYTGILTLLKEPIVIEIKKTILEYIKRKTRI